LIPPESKKRNKRIEHLGAWQGFTCAVFRHPDDNLSVVVLTNLDEGHSNPGLIAHVTAGLVHPPLLPTKLTPIADTQPAIAASLAKLLDEVVAGKDIRPQTTVELAADFTPDTSKRAQERLSKLWPRGTLTLLKRTPLAGGAAQFTSMFRLSKGALTLLISFGLDSNGKISTLGLSPDRDYE